MRDDTELGEDVPDAPGVRVGGVPDGAARRPTWSRGWRGHALVAVLFMVMGVVELWTPIVHGGYYLPGDIGQLWPITHVSAAPPVPHNSLESDVYVDFGPFLHYDISQFDQGTLPTWNPDNGNGQPYLADDQTVVLSPFTFPFYFLGFRLALIAAALARLWMLGFFTYLFLARHRLRTPAAVVGGVIFAYAGYHLVWLDYQTHVSVSASLPVGLWLLRVALDHRRGRSGADEPSDTRTGRDRSVRVLSLVGLAAVLAAMIFDGHPETAIFDYILIAGYAAVALILELRGWRARVRWSAGLAATAALAVGLSAIQLLPFAQYDGEGARPAAQRANPSASVADFLPDTAPVMAFPNLFGGPQFNGTNAAFFSRHKPQVNYAEVEGNAVGLVALCLGPLGVLALWRRRRQAIAWFGVAAAGAGTVLLYTRWAGLWWHHLPLVGTAGLNRSQDIQLMGIAVLAALGVDWVLRQDMSATSRRRAATAVAISFAGVGAVMVIGEQHLRHLVSRLPGALASSSAALRLVHDNVVAELAFAGSFAVVLALMLVVRQRVPRVIGAVTLAGLAFAANGLVMQSYNTTVPASLLYPRTPAVREVAKTIGSAETLFAGGSFPFASTNLWFGFDDVGSYDAIGFTWHDDLYEKVFGVATPMEEQMPACLNALRLFGVQWVIGGSGTWASPGTGGLALSRTIAGIGAYRVPGATPVSVVGRSIEASGGDGRALGRVSGCAFDPDTTVMIDTTAFNRARPGTLSAATGETAGSGHARIMARTATALSVRATSAGGGWLVVRQAYAPGWVATVDGRSEAVRRADVAFQAVRVPAGTHTVVLDYRPASVTDGALLSEASLVGSLVLVGLGLWWWRREDRAEGLSELRRRTLG
jgi:hypothetical protein